MASILLATAGSAVGTAIGGPVGGFVGKFLGASLGSTIDNKIFGAKKLPDVTGPRLADLSVQASTYGKAIPIVYGNMRLAGNVIWSQPIKETANTEKVTTGGKGTGGSSTSQKQTTFTYSVSLAIAICEGEIDEIIRVWADSAVINPTQGTYEIYKGSESQNPDSFIESIEGVGQTPAYRGMAYVVIQDFPLADYGNRIPNFTFEVKRRLIQVSDEIPVEEKIKAIAMIPGSGEFAYDTTIQSKTGGDNIGDQFVQNGTQYIINQNNRSGVSDAVASLDQLKSELPNVEWVSVVVGWFGNSVDAADCVIMPGVEYSSGAQTGPATWSVAGFDRSSAHLITQVDGSPVYGGTPDDQSIVRYVTELRTRGYKILFYPFIFMDMEGKPWRGTITGNASDTASFFTKTNGYNAFVSHYATLLNGKVDAFSIGSELIGLTGVNDGSNNFPAVTALISLAESVKSTLGADVKVTYAADWSEYHHTEGGWYNMDPLWASSAIDVIGIDAYFPLMDGPQEGYDKQEIINGWAQGEDYDWYYSDSGRTAKVTLAPAYALKNIEWWWSNTHTNPDNSVTAWVPTAKKIWFTEYGFPSVDGCANQPNVFYDPNSASSAFPRFSKGRVDFRAQRTAIEGTLDKWAGSSMVENMFLWTWDARPYPFFPDLRSVWSDGNLWLYGHWVNGKLGLSVLSAIITEICGRVGLDISKLDLSHITDLIDGFVVNNIAPARASIEQLQKGFFFDGIESDGVLKFIPRGNEAIATIDYTMLIPGGTDSSPPDLLAIKRAQELDLPQKIDVNYINRATDYQSGDQNSQRMVTLSQGKDIQSLSIVFNDWEAQRIADISLYNAWLARTSYQFSMPLQYVQYEPADVVNINTVAGGHTVRITESLIGLNGEIQCKAIAEDPGVYDFYAQPQNSGIVTKIPKPLSATWLEIMDLPTLLNDNGSTPYIRFAGTGLGENWPGAGVFKSDDNVTYGSFSQLEQPACVGNILDTLPDANPDIFDRSSSIQVSLITGSLESVTETAVLNGANLALVGDELIQFTNAELVSENKYKISGLLRGRLGTEYAVNGHMAAERFVLIDQATAREQMPVQLIGLERKYKAVTFGATLTSAAEEDFVYNANCLRPYSPAHVAGSRDISGNLSISWFRRTRIGGELRDGIDVPLSEESEKYEIDIYNGSDIIRTLNSATAEAEYSTADQIADFGSNQPSIKIAVYQLSAIVGRGFPAQAII